MESDLVEVVWSGPFHSDKGDIGDVITVTRKQADENPGHFRPLPKTVKATPADPVEASA